MERFSMELAGRTLHLETGELAQQAGGAVLVRYGDSVVLVTATASSEPREGVDFFPLTVDYEERLYAVGRIPGGFIKREGRPTEKAILACRLTDRPLRPLFPKGFRNSVHIVATVMSVDQDCPTEAMAITGASAALSISAIPFMGPIAAVVVGLVDGQFVINPNAADTEKSRLHLTVAGTKEAVMMVEAGALEVSEDDVLEAILKGHDAIKEIVALQEQMVDAVGVPKKEVPLYETPPEIAEKVRSLARDKIYESLLLSEKQEREDRISAIKKEVKEELLLDYPENEKDIKAAFEDILKDIVREKIIKEKVRPDGRHPDEIRPITCDVGVLPRTHGSGLFRRGQTQVLNVCTLGPLGDVQRLDGLGLEETKRFMHHYNFPPFSVGESGFMRGPGRREIGHGALAERAMAPIIPADEDFPYTIRLVSEVLESNGSTSMGSVCAGVLSLMDTGVPIKKPVAGVAMGLVMADEPVILTDIQGMEDFLGDMDFKVAGSKDGITALQMDIKIKGLSRDILAAAIKKAVSGYMYILEKMMQTIDAPRPELSKYAPRIIIIQIHPDKIREIIGPGGKMINKIIAETNTKIDIEPDGKVYIAAVVAENGYKARQMIENLTKDVEPGATYLGKVMRVEKYGAFVEVLPGKDGLVHISHLAVERVEKTEDVVKVGDEILVKVLDIDDRGRINLSRKAVLLKDSNGGGDEGSRPRDDRPRRDDRNRDDRNRDNRNRRDNPRRDDGNSKFGTGGKKPIS